MMDAKNIVEELLKSVNEATNHLDVQERIMVLCTLSEHCKTYAQTILAHEYLAALYGRRKEEE